MATVTASYNWVSGETVTPTKLNTTAAPTVVVADNEVTTAKILDANVTNAKLASGIDASKLTTGTLPIARIADAAVTAPKLQNGVTLQTVYSQTTSQTTVGSPYTIPLDNTKPQSSEGVEVLTASITPASATNKVLVEARLNGSTAGAATIVASLFRDSGADSISTVFVSSEGQAGTQISLTFQDSPSTTSATTYKIRAGYISTGSGYYINGAGDGSALFGAAVASWIKLTEIKAS
jgi:hypothetical protein